MLLESIKLENFQSHKDRKIEFSPAITTIKGATDKGKSAIIRALRWVCLNDFAGEEFITHGQKKVDITVSLKNEWDGFLVRRIRERGGNKNVYQCNEDEYRSFGSTVPSAIADVLGLSGINFQSQHDSPFWFAETAGEVSRQLNSVIDLSVIDTTLSNIASQASKAKEKKNLIEERFEQAKKDLSEIESKRERINDYAKLKIKADAWEDKKNDSRQLEALYIDIDSNQSTVLAEKASSIEELFNLAKRGINRQRRIDNLQDLLEELNVNTQRSAPVLDFTPVEQSFQRWEDLSQREAELEALIEQITRSLDKLGILQNEVDVTETAFHAAIKGKTCPLCLNPIR